MNILKNTVAVLTLAVVAGVSRQAAATLSFSNGGSGSLYSISQSGLNATIPDNSYSGVAYSINFAATGLNISDISVQFNLTSTYDGSIYAYLSHGSQIALLVNQITGAPNSAGFNVTLTTATGSDIHTATGTAGQPLSGTYLADSTGNGLTTFQNTDPNGNWTLFFADLGPGDAPTLNSFNVSITAVPEPITLALPIFGGLVLTGGLARYFLFRRAVRAA
jgi:subtilisin-like proprotein convertase family protein